MKNTMLIKKHVHSTVAWCHISQKLHKREFVEADFAHVPHGYFGPGAFFGGMLCSESRLNDATTCQLVYCREN